MIRPMRWLSLLVLGIFLIAGLRPVAQFMGRQIVVYDEKQVRPLVEELNQEHFKADITGQDIHYQKAAHLQHRLTSHYQNRIACLILSWMVQSRLVNDPLLKRQLKLIYLDYKGSQGNPQQFAEIIARQTEVEKAFTIFRPTWQGKLVSNQDLKQILVTSTDAKALVSAWNAGCQVGQEVGPGLLELVKLRNQIAREQGYRDFFQMQLALHEQSEPELDALFAEVDRITAPAYQHQKSVMDHTLARRLRINTSELKPWHYQQLFLQQSPPACEPKLDKYYGQQDIIPIIAAYFTQLGFPVQQLLDNSDLKPRPLKYPYAYCIDVDREGDVRILANLADDADSAQTLLHEMGHAVYDLKISPALPWRMREAASIGLTEGIAMMFGDRYADPGWLQQQLGLPSQEAARLKDDCRFATQLNNLIFCRWALVMYYFEKELYAHPDADLDSYWWQLVQKYQLIDTPSDPPAYAWAAKVHLATAPVYYYNYLLGRIIAYQLTEGWEAELANPQPNSPLGLFLSECLFAPGARLPWEEVLHSATGQRLDPGVLKLITEN